MESKSTPFAKDMNNIAGMIDLKLSSKQNVLTILSPDKETPRDVLTANLAVNWSRFLKVLVIDLNFNKTTFDSVFNTSENGDNLSDVLMNRLDTFQAATTHFKNLYLLSAGKQIDNLDLRLQTPEFSRIINHARATFDRVIINGGFTDQMASQISLAKLADTNVLVVSKQYSKKKSIVKLVTELESLNLPILGSVFVH